jgi:exopolysaccharide biosynthesis WecB/TagA/CpsF family protein
MFLEIEDQRHQGFGHEPTAEDAEVPGFVGAGAKRIGPLGEHRRQPLWVAAKPLEHFRLHSTRYLAYGASASVKTKGRKRVCGADLVDALCNDGQSSGLRHYFYGGKPGIAESMIRNLKAKYPDLVVAGFYAPPFRSLTEEEDAAIVDAINKSGARVVWIGLSTPNQEFWTRDHVGQINGATLIGVGAAFDFHSGAVTRAPKWMQKSGFEWLHRLLSEPRRLWRRYLVIAPSFVVKIVREEIGFRLAKRRPLSSHVAAARHD